MTENAHPIEDHAKALADDNRFCEWLDAIDPLDSVWPHSHYTAHRWLQEQCDVESLGRLATDPVAAASFRQIAHRFAVWDKNQELDL